MDSRQIDEDEQLIEQEPIREERVARAQRLRKYLVDLQIFMGRNKTEAMNLGEKSNRYHYAKTLRPMTTHEFKKLMHEEARLKLLLLYEGLAGDDSEVIERTTITEAWA